MLKKVALRIIGGLTYTDKMPCPSYSIPAQACRVGSQLAKVIGTVCATCYAMRGRYVFQNVKEAQARRLRLVELALDSESFRMQYVEAFRTLLEKETHFRWHDAGDLQSAEHLDLIADIAAATPHVTHWLPTRELTTIKQFRMRGNVIPSNLIVRYSMATVGMAPKQFEFPTSTVHKSDATIPPGSKVCDAKKRGGCGPCRACWNPKVKNVAYPWH